MTFWMPLEWGEWGVSEGFELPDRLLVDAIPPEGTIIVLTHPTSGLEVEVQVEEVFLDASNLTKAEYKAIVLPT